MIIVKLKGGIGNQMFQYAFGRKISLLNNEELILDNITGFENDFYQRRYKLNVFNIKAKEITSEAMLGFQLKKTQIKLANVNYRLNGIHIYHKLNPVKEPKFFNTKCDERLMKRKFKNVYFDGYWQNCKYFNDISMIIRDEFSLKHEISNKYKSLYQKILNSNSVSIHIRRCHGIGVNGRKDPKGLEKHGMIEMEYYNEAVSYLYHKQRNIVLFIFSDNPAWVNENIKFSIPFYFVSDHNNENEHIDLKLMSLCKHNIIANSTFSWWAAWLNTFKQKIVIAPKNWYADKKENSNVGIICRHWKKL